MESTNSWIAALDQNVEFVHRDHSYWRGAKEVLKSLQEARKAVVETQVDNTFPMEVSDVLEQQLEVIINKAVERMKSLLKYPVLPDLKCILENLCYERALIPELRQCMVHRLGKTTNADSFLQQSQVMLHDGEANVLVEKFINSENEASPVSRYSQGGVSFCAHGLLREICQIILESVSEKKEKTLVENAKDDENDVLHYVGGFVMRKLKNKLPKSLGSTIVSKMTKPFDENDLNERWTKICSRGGLLNINNRTLQLFKRMSILSNEVFKPSSANNKKLKHTAKGLLYHDPEIMLIWEELFVDVPVECKEKSLKLVIDTFLNTKLSGLCNLMSTRYQNYKKESLKSKPGLRQGLKVRN